MRYDRTSTTADCRPISQSRLTGKLKTRWPKTLDHYTQLQLLSATPQVRAALEQALPLLREALSAQGISLGDTYIGNQSQGEHHADQSPRGYPQRSSEPDAEVAAPLTTLPPGQSHGVDLFV